MRNKILFLLAYFTFLIYPFAFAEVPVASSTIFGVTILGVTVPILVGADGTIQAHVTSPFTDGSTDAQALLDASGSLNVNMVNDTRFRAVKTTENTLASTTAQTITLIANVKRVTIMSNEFGKEFWADFGNNAGLDNGFRCPLGIVFEDVKSTDIISYWASESVKLVIAQE